MKKRASNLFDELCSFELLLKSYDAARKRRKTRPDVSLTHMNYVDTLTDIQDKLRDGSWTQSDYRVFNLRTVTGKIRLIEAPLFPDRIVHHALYDILTRVLEPKMIDDSYSCRIGKGNLAAVQRAYQFVKELEAYPPEQRYVLKCDISKYFVSVDLPIMHNILERHIKDNKFLDVLYKAITPPHNTTNKGIPIGALTSQILSNIYLSCLDNHIKHDLKAKRYVRYADDFVIIGENKTRLFDMKSDIESFLKEHLKLKLNIKSGVFPIKQGLDYCGYRLFTFCIKPRKRVIKSFRIRIRQMVRDTKLTQEEKAEQFVVINGSLHGYFKHCDCYHTRESLMKPWTDYNTSYSGSTFNSTYNSVSAH